LFLISFAVAEDFTLDEDNRFSVYEFLKGTVKSFRFEDKIYILKMGNLDFEHDRVTIQWVSPQDLGTDILSLNKVVEIDLDDDDENDIGITLTNYYKDIGINENLVKGTVVLRFELLSDFSFETSATTTTIATTTTTTINNNVSEATALEDITGSQVGETIKVGDYKNWIIGVAIVLALVFIVIIRKKIINFLKNIFKNLKKDKKEEEEDKGPKEHMPCPGCGRDIIVGDKFCIGCGNKLPRKSRFCMKCGEKIRSESKFCVNCGNKI